MSPPFVRFYPSSTNHYNYHAPWENYTDEDGELMFLFETLEECILFYNIKHGVPYELIKGVDVCSSDCCSYMEENGLELYNDECQDDCSPPTTTVAPLCGDKASPYYHPPTKMNDSYWYVIDFIWSSVFNDKRQSHLTHA